MAKKPPRVQFCCPKPLLTYLNKQARIFCGGNRSEYLRHLVLQDLRGEKVRMNTSPTNPHVLSFNGQETDAQRQARLDKARKQALALANPAVAHALGNRDHQAMAQELKGALQRQQQKQTIPKKK